MTFFNMAMEVKKYNIEEIVCISKCASETNERKTKLFLLSERHKFDVRYSKHGSHIVPTS